ncbi:MAG TPA: hypothetical protein VG052_09190, partial [Puia sp.]|nr:hypothetical protein [Puia sp.]
MLRSVLFSLALLCLATTVDAQPPANSQPPPAGAIVPSTPAPPAKRPMRPADLYRLPSVSDPQPSPDGKWISYTLTTIDSLKDSRNADVWMISSDGRQDIQLTSSPDGESRARWSPDGRYLSFLSSR